MYKVVILLLVWSSARHFHWSLHAGCISDTSKLVRCASISHLHATYNLVAGIESFLVRLRPACKVVGQWRGRAECSQGCRDIPPHILPKETWPESHEHMSRLCSSQQQWWHQSCTTLA
ncbi:hypothetical protein HDV57DRAFT_256164 [Trichoderma longibrachiatum]